MKLEIRETCRNFYKGRNNLYICYEMILKNAPESRVVGECYLYTGEQYLLQFGNIGYSVFPEYQGRGYATQACRLLLGAARKNGLNQAVILVDADNTASRRVAEKLGAVLTENSSRENCTADDAILSTPKEMYVVFLNETKVL